MSAADGTLEEARLGDGAEETAQGKDNFGGRADVDGVEGHASESVLGNRREGWICS